MAEEPPDSARLRPNKAIRVNLTADGQNQSSVRQHTAGSGVHSDEDQSTTPVNDAESEAYSEDSPPSAVSERGEDELEESQAEVAPIEAGTGEGEDRLGTPSEVDEAVDQPVEEPPSVHSDSQSEPDPPTDDVEVASASEVEAANVAEVASAGSEDVQPIEAEEESVRPATAGDEQLEEEEDSVHEATAEELQVPAGVDILVIAAPEATVSTDAPARKETTQDAPPQKPPAPVPQPFSDADDNPPVNQPPPEPSKPAPAEAEVRSDPETDGDPYYDEDQFESVATQSVTKSLRTESRSMHVDSPSRDDGEEEEGYTSAYHSDHSDHSDSEVSDDEAEAPDSAEHEALRTELAAKDDEQEKLSAQMQAMQREMEELRRLLEEQQIELTNSSQELQRARAELDALRQEQADSAKASKAEKDAFRQVEKLMKERTSLKDQLEKLQEQMSKMESLQEKLQQRLRATELERDAIRQRLHAEAQLKKPHRIDEAESARLRTGGEFRPLQKPAKPAAKPKRRHEGATPRRQVARGGTGDVWCFQPRSKAALAIRVLPSLDAPRTGQKILPGDAFKVSEQHKGPSRDMVFLKLADGRGWAFNRSPDVGMLCVPRPAGKDPLAPYRLPEGNRLPGKIRQDHVTTHLARPRLPMIPKPVRDNRVPWH